MDGECDKQSHIHRSGQLVAAPPPHNFPPSFPSNSFPRWLIGRLGGTARMIQILPACAVWCITICSSSFYGANLSGSGDRCSGWMVSISHKHNNQAPGNENTHSRKMWDYLNLCLFYFFCARWRSLYCGAVICNRPSPTFSYPKHARK